MPREVKNRKPPKYELVLHEQMEDFQAIAIQSGEFDGVIYCYTIVSIAPKMTLGEEHSINFEYVLLEGNITEDRKIIFEDVLATILLDIVSSTVSDEV